MEPNSSGQKCMRLGMLGIALVIAIFVTRAGYRFQLNPFARYILSPTPALTKVSVYEDNNRLGLNPEPVVYMAFQAPAASVTEIVSKGAFSIAPDQEVRWFLSRSGPAAWHSGPLDDGSKLYFRSRRGNQEYLRLDRSGTNAYFLLWGI